MSLQRSTIFGNKPPATRPAPNKRRIAMDIQEVIRTLDVRRGVVCMRHGDFSALFYRNRPARAESARRAYERWKSDVRWLGLEAEGDVRKRGLNAMGDLVTDESVFFCIDAKRAMDWADTTLSEWRRPADDDEDEPFERTEQTRDTTPTRGATQARERIRRSKVKPKPVDPNDPRFEPTNEEVEEFGAARLAECREQIRRQIKNERVKEAKAKAAYDAWSTDPLQHRFRGHRPGRPDSNAACSLCGESSDAHPVHWTAGGPRGDMPKEAYGYRPQRSSD